MLDAILIKIERLEEILNDGKAQREGAHPSNLSPYGTIIQYLFDAEKDKMITFLSNDETKTKILIPAEIELPADVDRSKFRNAVFVAKALKGDRNAVHVL